jgi:hypothetical protein
MPDGIELALKIECYPLVISGDELAKRRLDRSKKSYGK